MNKIKLILISISIVFVILSATHLHSSASSYTDSYIQSASKYSNGKLLAYPHLDADGSTHITFVKKGGDVCDPGTIREECRYVIEVTYYMGSYNEKDDITKTKMTDADGKVRFSHSELYAIKQEWMSHAPDNHEIKDKLRVDWRGYMAFIKTGSGGNQNGYFVEFDSGHIIIEDAFFGHSHD